MSGPSNPLLKTVARQAGGWLSNYRLFPAFAAAPITAYVALAAAFLSFRADRRRSALLASSAAVAGVITTAGFSLFLFLLPSSSHPDQSLTIWDSSSSQMTLMIMLAAVVVFLPIVIAYTSWVYYVLRGSISEAAIERGEDYYY